MRKAVAVTVMLAVAAMAGLVWLLLEFSRPFQGYAGASRMIVVPRGDPIPRIARILESEGIVRSATLFHWYVRLTGSATDLKAGEYLFQQPLSIAEVCRRLREGRIHRYRVTVAEGLSMAEISALFSREGFGAEEEFDRAFGLGHLIGDLDPQAGNLEGYLFPETYFVTRDMSEAEIARAMVRNFRQAWTPERMARARQLKMSVRDVVTLASLIEKETGLASERPLISGVFHNRLNSNLPLACDPTVIYAVNLVKEFDGIIHQSDLELDSPYNTYLYPGLPPGPIANPGLDSIDAALAPADTDYLYFVSRNDGSHHFSSTYREHSRAVREYQR